MINVQEVLVNCGELKYFLSSNRDALLHRDYIHDYLLTTYTAHNKVSNWHFSLPRTFSRVKKVIWKLFEL